MPVGQPPKPKHATSIHTYGTNNDDSAIVDLFMAPYLDSIGVCFVGDPYPEHCSLADLFGDRRLNIAYCYVLDDI